MLCVYACVKVGEGGRLRLRVLIPSLLTLCSERVPNPPGLLKGAAPPRRAADDTLLPRGPSLRLSFLCPTWRKGLRGRETITVSSHEWHRRTRLLRPHVQQDRGGPQPLRTPAVLPGRALEVLSPGRLHAIPHHHRLPHQLPHPLCHRET